MKSIAFFLLLLGPCWVGGISSGDGPAASLWWPIEISGEVVGAFDLRIGPVQATGTYRFHFFWNGSMERDNGDYILYQGTGSVSDLEWNETHRDIPSGKLTRIPVSDRKPEFRTTYVLRDEENLVFSGAFSPLMLDMKNRTSISVWLPRGSEGPAGDQSERYNRDVVAGSNHLVLVERRIYAEDETVEDFSWEWRRSGPEGSQRHEVRMRFKVSKMKK